jgi:hypothetical protein
MNIKVVQSLMVALTFFFFVSCSGSRPLAQPKSVHLAKGAATNVLMVDIAYSEAYFSVQVTIDILEGGTVVSTVSSEKLLLATAHPNLQFAASVEASVPLASGKTYTARVSWKEPSTEKVLSLTSGSISN